MILIIKQPKLSCHMASMPINDCAQKKTEITPDVTQQTRRPLRCFFMEANNKTKCDSLCPYD